MMKYNLIITYKDDREDVYQLGDGFYTLGSDSNCEISIQAAGVCDKHVVFDVKNGEVWVVNLQHRKMVRLNGVALDGRSKLNVGDVAEIGDVCARLRLVGDGTVDLTESSDGVSDVAISARKDVRSGWRGYRKALEKISPFISPTEAQEAEQLHREGLGALVRWLIAVIVMIGASWFLEKHGLFLHAKIVSRVSEFLSLIAILILTVRYRIRFAGRILLLGSVICSMSDPPNVAWQAYFDELGYGGMFVMVIGFALGWIYDIGAGCIFYSRRKQFLLRYILLLVANSVFCLGVFYLLQWAGEELPLSIYWYLLDIVAVVSFPLWARIVPQRTIDKNMDINFVAELASIRAWRTWLSRALAILAAAAPLFYILTNLGATEMLMWDEDDKGLVVTTEDSGEKVAWFWEDRGRYLHKDDFNSELIYQVPYSNLASRLNEVISDCVSTNNPAVGLKENGSAEDGMTAEERPGIGGGDVKKQLHEKIQEFALLVSLENVLASKGIDLDDSEAKSAFLDSVEGTVVLSNCIIRANGLALGERGEKICGLVAAVQENATNGEAYAELEKLLIPYRVHASDAGKFASHLKGRIDAQAFYLEELKTRETSQTGTNPTLYHAQVQIGIFAKTRQKASIEAAKISSIIVPDLVLLCIGCLLLWRRGGDSPVGFWMGIFLVGNALGVFGFLNVHDLSASIRYNLWHMAAKSHIGSIAATWFATLEKSGTILAVCLSTLAQSVLFVLLCWPGERAEHRGKWQRCSVFVGKLLVAFAIGAGAGVIMVLAVASVGNDSMNWLLSRSAAIISLGTIGYLLRRKRRFATEVPELGWEFIVSWIFLATSVGLPVSLFQAEGMQSFENCFSNVSWVFGHMSFLGIVAGTCAVLGGVFFLRICLRKNFLSVLSTRGFTFIVLAFIIPIFAKVCESFAEDMIHGTFLQSQSGERVLAILLSIVLFAPLWKVLSRMSRKFSMRNLVKVEANVEQTLESVLDSQDDLDIRDEIFTRMRELGLTRYAFYSRGHSGNFNLLLKNGWVGKSVDSFQMSEYLRRYLGKNHQAIDLEQLAQERQLFFQSFELCRLASLLHASCLQPICLGSSVRAVIVTPDELNGGVFSNSEVFFDNVNALGLAAVASLRPSQRQMYASKRGAE